MNIAIFASGEGTNAEAIIRHLSRPGSPHRATLVVTDRPGAGVLARARALGVDTAVISRAGLADEAAVTALLDSHGVGFIALAGFLALIPRWLTGHYRGRIVNIHPSLLPRHGGKGMYGRHVHEAVLAAGDSESGITIHYVDPCYDTGAVIFQATVSLAGATTAAEIERRVRSLEPIHYPAVITSILDHIG